MGYLEARGFREVVPLPDDIEEISQDALYDDNEVSGPHDIIGNDDGLDVVEVREHWAPGELQIPDIIPAFEIPGFAGMEVVATLQKKKERTLKDPHDPQYRNQDNIIVDPEIGFIAVADELGSANKVGGSAQLEKVLPKILRKYLKELASTAPEEVCAELIQRQRAKFEGSEHFIADLVRDMNNMVRFDPELAKKGLALLRAISEANKSIQDTGSMTTFCGGLVHVRPDGSRWPILANIGDSGAYKQRENGEMIPLFHEDALLEIVLKSGAMSKDQLRYYEEHPTEGFELPINKAIAIANGIPPEQAEKFVAKKLTQKITFNKMKSTMYAAIGGSSAVAALTVRRFNPGEKLLLVTDGVQDMFPKADGHTTDAAAIGKALRGKTLPQQLDALREESVMNGELGVAVNKTEDDIAALVAAFN